MKNKIIVFLSILFFALTGCTGEEVPMQPANRTMLVYMIANNNLDMYGRNNIRNMAAVTTKSNLNGGTLLVYYAPKNYPPKLVRIEATADNLGTQEAFDAYIDAHCIKEYPYQNGVDPTVMRSVIQDAVELSPADHYGMVLWSHGTAWIPGNFTNMLRSFGSDGGKQMEIDELAEGLPDHFFDFLLFDACYMASAECVYELKDKAEYIIGSGTETLGDGFPYKSIVPHFFAPNLSVEKIAEDFYTYYQNSSTPYASVSVTKTSELEGLAASIRAILSTKTEAELYALSLDEMQVLERLLYNPHFLYDLDDFIKQLATADQYNRFKEALEKAIVCKYFTKEGYFAVGGVAPIDRFSGLSVYVPQQKLPKINEWYKRLKWYQAVYR